ncbi:MAG: hypothetical protein K6G55_06605 [Selenomonadaceae bacterium]|nr:hypothetical protein [Selenomonadaceae bacterium]
MDKVTENYLNRLGDSLKGDLEETLKKLRQWVEAEFRAQTKFIEVVTDIEASENLSPVEDDDCIFFADNQSCEYERPKTFHSKSFFLRTTYEEFFTLLNKNYSGAGFTYQLKPNYHFVESEEKIFRISRIYREPLLIFSPYARRAVDICIFGEPQKLDFRFAENNLKGKILVEKDFYRNVEIKSADDFYADLPDESTYFLPSTPVEFDDELVAKRIDGKIYFDPNRDIRTEDCERIKILPTESKIDGRIFGKQRLRTKGDIEFVLSGLKRDGYSCSFGQFGNSSAEKIKRYTREHRYYSLRDEKFLRAKMQLPMCIVKFRGEEIFLTDYANFVLQFLEETYPEFNWVGERDV